MELTIRMSFDVGADKWQKTAIKCAQGDRHVIQSVGDAR